MRPDKTAYGVYPMCVAAMLVALGWLAVHRDVCVGNAAQIAAACNVRLHSACIVVFWSTSGN
jgi:hypothetical protein